MEGESHILNAPNYKWDNAFKNGPSKIPKRLPLKNMKVNGLLKYPFPPRKGAAIK